MNGVNLLTCFQFNNDAALDQQVNFQRAADFVTLIRQLNPLFTFHSQVRGSELNDETFSIYRFEQPRAEIPMHLDSAANNLVGVCMLLIF